MVAVFWIETVFHNIMVPIFKPGQPPLIIKGRARACVPTFAVTPPMEITEPQMITVTSPQLQYSQAALRNFNGITWPIVSVATLVPAEAIIVPTSVWG